MHPCFKPDAHSIRCLQDQPPRQSWIGSALRMVGLAGGSSDPDAANSHTDTETFGTASPDSATNHNMSSEAAGSAGSTQDDVAGKQTDYSQESEAPAFTTKAGDYPAHNHAAAEGDTLTGKAKGAVASTADSAKGALTGITSSDTQQVRPPLLLLACLVCSKSGT